MTCFHHEISDLGKKYMYPLVPAPVDRWRCASRKAAAAAAAAADGRLTCMRERDSKKIYTNKNMCVDKVSKQHY